LGTKAWHEIREVQQNIGRDPWQEPAPTEDLTALRDQAALVALHIAWDARATGYGEILNDAEMARCAWQIADAFIAAREGKTDG
jgi:hypothetical protein